MPENLKITLCQCPAVWESAAENCSALSAGFDAFWKDCEEGARPDIMVLPEFFSTGFTMRREVAQKSDGATVRWMKEVSQNYGTAIAGSVAIEEDGKVFNRMFFIAEGSVLGYYDKRHLFRMGAENDFYSAGESRTLIDFKGWKIALNVCYDLRFPIWSRNAGMEYDLMINAASWPSSRGKVIEPLVKARAIENMSYFAFVNRVGNDPENTYGGGSLIVNPRGEDIALRRVSGGIEFYSASLSYSKLSDLRERFPVWMDADKFEIIK